MKLEIDNRPTRRQCRYCKQTARWDLMRHYSRWDVRHTPVCDLHLGTGLRNAGLVALSIEQSSVCTAEIRP